MDNKLDKFIQYFFKVLAGDTNVLFGSLCVKSPNGLNLTVSDFNETWYTCCLGTHSTKSEILGQSDLWYW